MLFSKLLIPTMKEKPNDATVISHIYLTRAGFIQSVGSGLYNFLPLGKKVLDKISNVIRKELYIIGAKELSLAHISSVLTLENNKEIFSFNDKKLNKYTLISRDEELMVDLFEQSFKSYNELPLNVYQINFKFRDEEYPKFGLLRSREFLMKSGYSFHNSLESMKYDFDLMEKVYKNIFTKLGLEYKVVEGKNNSREFIVLSNCGEETIIFCDECKYSANIEVATARPKIYKDENSNKIKFEKIHTPKLKTIEELSSFFELKNSSLIKIVAKKAFFKDDSTKVILFALRGSQELQETKGCSAIGAKKLIDINEFELKEKGLIAGFMGVLGLNKDTILVYDRSLKDAKNMICGANEKDYHFQGVSINSLDIDFFDLSTVKNNSQCNFCDNNLRDSKGIKIGNISQLRTQYKENKFIMGTYKIGVSRLVATVIEQHHDDKGCIWTDTTTPFKLTILISNIKNREDVDFAKELYKDLKEKGIEVLLDDRKERFGSKIKDYELLGFPYAIIIGKKLKEGFVEMIRRDGLTKEDISIDNLLEKIIDKMANN